MARRRLAHMELEETVLYPAMGDEPGKVRR